jgi:hypothetical protein
MVLVEDGPLAFAGVVPDAVKCSLKAPPLPSGFNTGVIISLAPGSPLVSEELM